MKKQRKRLIIKGPKESDPIALNMLDNKIKGIKKTRAEDKKAYLKKHRQRTSDEISTDILYNMLALSHMTRKIKRKNESN